MSNDREFEKSIKEVLMKNHFFFTQRDSAVKEMCSNSHVYISIITYKTSLDTWDEKYVTERGLTDVTKNVYWIQFRNNTEGHFYFVEDAAYIYSPADLQLFIDNWQDHYKIALSNMRERFDDEGREMY